MKELYGSKIKKILKHISLFMVLVLVLGLFTPINTQAETIIITEEDAQEYYKKMRYLLETYVDPGYFQGDRKSINASEEQYNELKRAALEVTSDCDTQYEKIQAITEFVADRTYYDLYDYTDTPYVNAYDVYQGRRTVCDGYANLVRALCITVDIPCMKIIGTDHAYNGAYDSDNKRWILTDATWCSSNEYTEEQEWKYRGSNLEWFDITIETIDFFGTFNHEIYGLEGILYNSAYYSLDNSIGRGAAAHYIAYKDWILEPVDAVGEIVKIPSEIEGIKVFCDSFAYESKVKVLDLSESNITSITLTQCTSLEEIIFPDELVSISGGLGGCTKLREVDLSNTQIQKLPSSCFANCTSLESVKLPKTVTSMGDEAFSGCSNIKEIDLSTTRITEMPDDVFKGCVKLEKIKLPSTLKAVDSYSFRGCGLIEELDFSQTQIESIPSYCFQGLKNLKTILFPKTLTTLETKAFDECESIEELDFSNTQITEIPDGYFENYTNLKKVLLPETLTTIGESAFEECTSLKEIILDHTNITRISGSAFFECTELEKVTFPSTLESIGEYAFYDTKIAELDFYHTQLKSIEEYAFSSIDELVSIKFPDTIEYLGDFSFKLGYKKDTYVYLPVNSTFDESEYIRTDYAWSWRGRIIIRLDENGNVVNSGGWKEIDGKRYYFDKNTGVMLTNQWIDDTYYLTASGAMATGWLLLDETYYYMGADGAKVTNRWIGNYYLDENGAMATNAWVDNGRYYVGSDGVYISKSGWFLLGGDYYYLIGGLKQTGWILDGSTWYYMDSKTGVMLANEWLNDTYYMSASGAMVSGWLLLDGTWYYMGADGAKVTKRWIGNYYLDENGVMATNAWVDNGRYYVGSDGVYISKSGWFLLGGDYYYLIGGLKQTGWILDGSTWYYMNPKTGVMLANEWLNDTYYMSASGAMVSGWLLLDGTWYYMGADGAKVTNRWIGNYYLQEDGTMATNAWVDNGRYYVGADGAWDAQKTK